MSFNMLSTRSYISEDGKIITAVTASNPTWICYAYTGDRTSCLTQTMLLVMIYFHESCSGMAVKAEGVLLEFTERENPK
jgi:hypothetical protein